MATPEIPIFAITTDLQEFDEVKAETIARAPDIAIQYAERYLEFLRLDLAWHQENWHSDSVKPRKEKIGYWEEAIGQVKDKSEEEQNWEPLKNLLIDKALSELADGRWWEIRKKAKNLLVLASSLPTP
ncbi:MAG: hypothetical protein WBD86_00490 [Microgenomates group bacterium]